MPTGAVISPPDSSSNSSEDEAENHIKRGRQVVDVKELEAAIRNSIPQRREASPVMVPPNPNEVFAEPRSPEILSARIHQKLCHVASHPRPAVDGFGSRTRVPASQPPPEEERGSQEGSPNIEDDAFRIAPPMVRKKSGELVKSSLKSPNLRRRPSSMPSTPTYPKVVHFDSHLEHVRHFIHSERPTAVSAGSSPVESGMDTDSEYPFPSDEPPFEWEIGLPNFPDRVDRSSAMVRVEKVTLSHDKKALLGSVAVANISFQKLVVARFTLDYWQTTSEVAAEYTNDIRRRHTDDGYDRFTFKVKLEDMANLENKTLFFCVRYRVDSKEFWDNNNSINYQVDFRKKAIPQHGKSGPSSASSKPLPRSKGVNSSAPRPRSMPIFDDSFDAYDLRTQPEYKMFNKAMDAQRDMVIKAAKKSSVVDPEALARRANPSGNAFGNRYDFEASLAAAMATATKVLGPERSGLKLKTGSSKDEKQAPNPYFHSLAVGNGLPRSHSSPSLTATFIAASDKSIPKVDLDKPTDSFRPSLDALKTLATEKKPSIESASYKEILENFCFFGSAKPSPQLSTGDSMPVRAGASSHENNTLAMLSPRTIGSRSPSPNSPFSTSGYRLREDQDEPGSASVPVSGTLPPEHLNEREAGIFVKLAEKLSPSRLDALVEQVRDISGGCGSMYAVEIESPLFRGLTTLKMHRQVQDVLAEEIKGWHGIQLKTKATPVEG
ncbi:hypothetical protein Dda_1833 [Drechslerella dactyloides]|uniref:CBM21 domain-containing protein n=1 Tax=Drechslerella dactyloides TaxID=74499 RepID=A0AAD6NM49_DREDA|nr:hypothetical protein Dda_1833 [Drechslerella dactyloides]